MSNGFPADSGPTAKIVTKLELVRKFQNQKLAFFELADVGFETIFYYNKMRKAIWLTKNQK